MSDLLAADGPPRDDGVDVSLIRWFLTLTPEQRLRTLEETLRSLEELKAGMPRD